MQAICQLFVLLTICFVNTVDCGFVFISGDDSDDSGHCETASSCSGLIVDVFSECISTSNIIAAQKDVLAIGVDDTYQSQAYTGFSNWQQYVGFSYDIVHDVTGWTQKNFSKYRMIYIPRLRSGCAFHACH
jgi:hypothetical protein